MLGNSRNSVRIESGVVVAVYVDRYAVDVVTVPTNRLLRDVPFSTPTSSNGHGINFMPARGSACWVMLNSSDPSSPQLSPCILAWQPVRSGDSFSDGRRQLNEDDLCFSTPGGSEILLRSNGLVEIRGGALARTLYVPTTNTIRTLCQNMEVTTLGGSFSWSTVSSPELDSTSTLAFALKQLSSDSSAFLTITAGDSAGGMKIMLLKDGQEGSADIGADGNPEGFACSWSINKDGTVSIEAATSISINAVERVDVSAAQLSLSSTSSVNITCGSSSIVLSPESITLISPSLNLLVDSATAVNSAGIQMLSMSANSPALLTAAALPFILTHTHGVAGANTLPPTEAPGVVESFVTTQSTGIV
jgi:hypothetical protein